MAINLISTLRKIPLFDGLNDDELEIILDLCNPIKLAAKKTLFKENDPSHDLYILLSGSIRLSTQKAGAIHTLKTCDVFGEIGLITQHTRSATATALSDSGLLRIHHIEFNLLLGKHPRVFATIMKNISTHLASHVVRMNNTPPLEHIPNTQNTVSATNIPQILSSTPK